MDFYLNQHVKNSTRQMGNGGSFPSGKRETLRNPVISVDI
jgi:hypothetical protein